MVHDASSPTVTQRYELPTAGSDREGLAARLLAAGALGVWERPELLVAWFLDRDREVPAGGTWSVEPDRDWQAEWKATIGPVRAGAFTIVPSWLAEDVAEPPERTVVVIDPGRAFGTGHHASTRLCLELLDPLDLRGRTLLDVGCGTGILAVAAVLRGARAVAVDVDPVAVAVAADNAVVNGVAVDLRVGSVGDVAEPADVVVANLVTDVVVELAADLAVRARERLVVSGIASDRGPAVEEALRSCGLHVVDRRETDGWVALAAAHRRG